METMNTACSSGGCVRKFMNTFVAENDINGIILLHAFKSANAVLCKCSEIECHQLNVPYCFIFGGTDINVDMHNEERCAIMKRAIDASKFAIAFTYDMKQSAEKISSSTPIFIQPQAVEVPISMNYVPHLCSPSTLENPMKPMLFLLITSIRPVKDPLFILEEFLDLCATYPDFGLKLLIIGPILDEAYSAIFFKRIEHLKNKYEYHPTSASSDIENRYDEIHTWMHDRKSFPILYSSPLPNKSFNELLSVHVFASINSSKNEGMSSAILESMVMGVPVIAREIPGNCAVICESKTGLLFDTPKKFLEQTKRLLLEPSLRMGITKNALDYVSVHHSPEGEKQFYVDMCLQYLQ